MNEKEGQLIARILFNEGIVSCSGDITTIHVDIGENDIGKTIIPKYGDIWTQLSMDGLL
jgi:hypothetical protein